MIQSLNLNKFLIFQINCKLKLTSNSVCLILSYLSYLKFVRSLRIRPFFPSSNKSCHFIGFKTCAKPSIFCSRPSQEESGSIPDLTSQSTLHARLQRVLMRCNSVCDVKSVTDRLPFWLGREQKGAWLANFAAHGMEEGKNSRNAFRTSPKIYFSEKNILVLAALNFFFVFILSYSTHGEPWWMHCLLHIGISK